MKKKTKKPTKQKKTKNITKYYNILFSSFTILFKP